MALFDVIAQFILFLQFLQSLFGNFDLGVFGL